MTSRTAYRCPECGIAVGGGPIAYEASPAEAAALLAKGRSVPARRVEPGYWLQQHLAWHAAMPARDARSRASTVPGRGSEVAAPIGAEVAA